MMLMQDCVKHVNHQQWQTRKGRKGATRFSQSKNSHEAWVKTSTMEGSSNHMDHQQNNVEVGKWGHQRMKQGSGENDSFDDKKNRRGQSGGGIKVERACENGHGKGK